LDSSFDCSLTEPKPEYATVTLTVTGRIEVLVNSFATLTCAASSIDRRSLYSLESIEPAIAVRNNDKDRRADAVHHAQQFSISRRDPLVGVMHIRETRPNSSRIAQSFCLHDQRRAAHSATRRHSWRGLLIFFNAFGRWWSDVDSNQHPCIVDLSTNQ
jgi:hypothetical protein